MEVGTVRAHLGGDDNGGGGGGGGNSGKNAGADRSVAHEKDSTVASTRGVPYSPRSWRHGNATIILAAGASNTPSVGGTASHSVVVGNNNGNGDNDDNDNDDNDDDADDDADDSDNDDNDNEDNDDGDNSGSETSARVNTPVASSLGGRRPKSHWSISEHVRFLTGMQRYGRGKWKLVAAHVGTRTNQQVQQHAKKYFLRKKKTQNDKRVRSIHDIELDSPELTPLLVSANVKAAAATAAAMRSPAGAGGDRNGPNSGNHRVGFTALHAGSGGDSTEHGGTGDGDSSDGRRHARAQFVPPPAISPPSPSVPASALALASSTPPALFPPTPLSPPPPTSAQSHALLPMDTSPMASTPAPRPSSAPRQQRRHKPRCSSNDGARGGGGGGGGTDDGAAVADQRAAQSSRTAVGPVDALAVDIDGAEHDGSTLLDRHMSAILPTLPRHEHEHLLAAYFDYLRSGDERTFCIALASAALPTNFHIVLLGCLEREKQARRQGRQSVGGRRSGNFATPMSDAERRADSRNGGDERASPR